MKTEWDYTNLAEAYLKRPDYADSAIDQMISLAKITKGSDVCDVGAGAAHLTIKLAKQNLNVVAVEPNDAMRKNGIKRTANQFNIRWYEGTGENTGQPANFFDLVTFGSSFNVTNRELALQESARILKKGGWFVCMWNHRDLNDPLQTEIEKLIRKNIGNYNYGTRREDQTSVINASGLFSEVYKIEGRISHIQTLNDCVEAWRSHATLQRQVGDKFNFLIAEIERLLRQTNLIDITIPYTTKIWMSEVRKG